MLSQNTIVAFAIAGVLFVCVLYFKPWESSRPIVLTSHNVPDTIMPNQKYSQPAVIEGFSPVSEKQVAGGPAKITDDTTLGVDFDLDEYSKYTKYYTRSKVKGGLLNMQPYPLGEQDYSLGVDSKDPALSKFFTVAPNNLNDRVENYLPKETRSDWWQSPSPTISFNDANLLLGGLGRVGIDTIGSSRRNGSWDIRGDVVIPKQYVSPWNESDIDPDTNVLSYFGSREDLVKSCQNRQ